MASFTDTAFASDAFDTPNAELLAQQAARPRRVVDDVKRIWGLWRHPSVERLSREYRAWWRKN